MRHGNPVRWNSQRELVGRITRITTRCLPDGEGVALRFINQEAPSEEPNIGSEDIKQQMETLSWVPNSETQIGTNLRSKILEPLVYQKLAKSPPELKRPLLVSIITDGSLSQEGRSKLVDEIMECGQQLESNGYDTESVKFFIGQVGDNKGAKSFLDSVRSNKNIERVVHVTTGEFST
ncbi:hypothetical protein AA313_de0203734 [Arthrobotrys entomopaga]|nr:hypothetical protein AA313_de0203734 [Arthrobotrys entomopaga]